MGAVHLRRLRRVRPGLPDRGPDAGLVVDKATGRGTARPTARSTASAPICGVGCQITYHVRDDKIA